MQEFLYCNLAVLAPPQLVPPPLTNQAIKAGEGARDPLSLGGAQGWVCGPDAPAGGSNRGLLIRIHKRVQCLLFLSSQVVSRGPDSHTRTRTRTRTRALRRFMDYSFAVDFFSSLMETFICECEMVGVVESCCIHYTLDG